MGNTAFKIIIPTLAVAALVFVYFYMSDAQEIKTLKLGNTEIQAEIADTYALRVQGLSGRESLAENAGMLFIYDDKKIRNFWMKDMRIPLDVLWIADNAVVGIQENIPFEASDVNIVGFKSENEVNWVLEVNAGWIAKNEVKVGDRVDIVED